ncbi:MAG: LuxR family transcriptional regulator, maltose regulon positive regulatory protein [Solirubrobacteraceae bacterium]|nr:LuxR family transcriptional regulator, maltose regulon positive regulatory protein [Solirubrobacteraceae bacterium]
MGHHPNRVIAAHATAPVCWTTEPVVRAGACVTGALPCPAGAPAGMLVLRPDAATQAMRSSSPVTTGQRPRPSVRRVRTPPSSAGARAGRIPAFHRGLVPRPRLVRRLAGDPAVRLVLLVAPAGYGKTTLLSEWVRREARTVAWLTLGPEDGAHPGRLAAKAARALDACGGGAEPSVLVLDDAHVMHTPAATAVVEALLDGLGEGSVLAIASRREPALRLSRLRAERAVAELGASDLAMSPVEAAMLLERAGVPAHGDELRRLTDETEGWPVGLYLAAVSLHRQTQAGDRTEPFTGEDRLMSDYVRDEVLADLPDAQVTFLRRTSVLDRLSGPLCDAVLEGHESGALLHDLARGNALITPLGPSDREYRCHPLLAGMLRGELQWREPQCAATMHRRASAWHERHDDHERAIGHALEAGDLDRAAVLLWDVVAKLAFGGGQAALGGWLEAFGETEIAARPVLAVAAAAHGLATGERDRMEHWAALAARGIAAGAPADADAQAAAALLGGGRLPTPATAPGAAWRCLRLLLDGAARHLAGDRETARRLLEGGVRAGAMCAPLLQALCLAQLTFLAAERDDWDEAALQAARARQLLDHPGVGAAPAAALAFAASAAVHAHRGSPERAREAMNAALALQDDRAAFAPWACAETCIWLARAEVRLSDVAGARTLLARASRSRREAPEAVVLADWIDDVWDRADAFAAGGPGAITTLTIAELRVLRFLPSHLSFREIGARLHVSANTVKTQALAVYRKLDVSSRSEAVARANAVGLLDR